MDSGRWGYTIPNGILCSRCKYSTTNPPCISCNKVLCEPCRHFSKDCCDNMEQPRNHIPSKEERENATSTHTVENPHLDTLLCTNKDCMTRTTFSKLQLYKVVDKQFGFCAMCGEKAKIIEYNTDNYWAILGKRYGMKGELVKQLYGLWDTKEFPRFADFISDFKKEAEGVS